MPIQWNDRFASGEREIDDQHIMLFDFVNILEDRINDHPNNPMERKEIAQRLQFLRQYVLVHFEYEENCMFKHKCAAAHSNKQAHDDFIAYFTNFMQTFEAEGPTVAVMTDLHTTLADWLTNHILNTDTSLRRCI